MKTKSVAWSYPTSPNAERFGHPDGCYVVEVNDGNGPLAIGAFPTEAGAKLAAEFLPYPWDRFTL